PHVVMIIIDTLRADKLGSYGHPETVSPELDAIARDGVRFTDVLAQSSWTRPSIGSLLTSRYPRTLGLYEEQDHALPAHFETLAEVLRSHGYTTIGLTANPNINTTFNFHQGFDHYQDSTVRWGWMETDSGKPTNKQQALQSARQLFDKAFEVVGSGHSGPFYLQVNLMEVHEYKMKAERSLVPETLQTLYQGLPDSKYLRAVRQASLEVGAFVERWRAKVALRDTLFIILSDHGEGLGDHPGVRFAGGHGSVLYESNLKVPLILSHPGRLEAREVTQRVRLLDLMPTVLDYLGLPAPIDSAGVSVMPWVRGEAATLELPDYFVAETAFRKREKIAVYGEQWKWIENRKRHRGIRDTELQRMGRKEDGVRTDQQRGQIEEVRRLRRYRADWERRFPKAAPHLSEALPPNVREQLQSLGYLP
ncbi:MAG: sulfatase, partial [Acidobacteriota bacterium]